MKPGDKIFLPSCLFGYSGMGCITIEDYWENSEPVEFTVEEFRHALGIFESEQHRTAEHFTPLCHLYGPTADSEQKYIPNWGEYETGRMPIWRE